MRRLFIYFALLLGLFIAAASAPSPLYSVFQKEWHFSAIILTLIFAVYAFGLLLALLFFGSLSDYIGRRPVLFGAIVLEAIGMFVFALAGNVGWLFVARLFQGVATGMATAVLSASLIDTQPKERPGLAPLVSTIVPVAGLGIGALISGVLVSYVLWPTHLVFWMLFGLIVVMGALLFFAPEPVTLQPGWKKALLPVISLPKKARAPFIVAAPSLIAVWALTGLYLSLAPSVATGMLGGESHLVGGLVITALTISAALSSYILREHPNKWLLVVGAITSIVGLAITAGGVYYNQAVGLFVGTIIAGLGFGPAFTGAFRSIMSKASKEGRAGLASTVYILSYLSLGIPAVIVGGVSSVIGLSKATIWYSAVLIVLYIVTILLLTFKKQEARTT